MSCMKAEVVKEPSIEICNAKELITNVAEIQTFDLYTVDKDCVNFTATFKLTVKKTGSLTAIIGYFDVFFDLDNPICFSTGPESTPTHWKQTVFSLSEPISITEGTNRFFLTMSSSPFRIVACIQFRYQYSFHGVENFKCFIGIFSLSMFSKKL